MKHLFIKGSSTHTIILLHGTGGNEHDLVPLAKAIDSHAHILSIRGNIVEAGMPRFFKRTAPGIFDLENLKEETINLYDFMQEAEMTYGINLNDATVIGYSNGANIASSVLLTYTNPLHRAILLRPMVPFKSEINNRLDNTSLLILSSKNDPIVAYEESDNLYHMFISRGAHTTHHWLNSGHQLTENDIKLAYNWYHQI
ncbi:MAG: alpha/beta hydrolase [Acholeplasmataceae bacterium]|jgi:phospholipase/carboxylesterase|nr:alpha/beta hydrolase [Acholeplasmataceae bacterium]